MSNVPKIPILFLLIVSTPVSVLSLAGSQFAAPLGLLVSVVILWVTNLIPVSVTGMLVPCLAVLFGILSPAAAFAPFGSSILGLFLGVFLLVEGVRKFGLDKRIAVLVLRSPFATSSPARLVFITAISAWLLGMWMSNTATCALLLPVCLGILEWSKAHLDHRKYQTFSTRLLLTCAYTPSLGGMATPIGSVPNALAIEQLSKRGFTIGFSDWLLMALPVSFVLLLLSMIVLHMLFPLGKSVFKRTSHEEPPHREHRAQHRVLVIVLVSVVLLWLVPEMVSVFQPQNDWLAARLPLALPAILGAISLFVIRVKESPLLDPGDLAKIDWGTILFFGGGLCLGEVLNSSGMAAELARILITRSEGDPLALPLAIATTSTVLSEISSNTTTASIIVPILTSLFEWMPAEQSMVLILCSVFAAGLGFMLPISTPPNAMVFATGRIKLSKMILAGIIMDVAGILVITAYSFWRMG